MNIKIVIIGTILSIVYGCTPGQLTELREKNVVRLLTDMNALIEEAEGAIFAYDFYNEGRGLSLPGTPAEDSLIAWRYNGERPNGGFSPSIVVGRQYARTIADSQHLICHRARQVLGQGHTIERVNHAIWRPAPLERAPRRTTFAPQMSIEEHSVIRMIARNRDQNPSRFRFSTSDHLQIEFKQGSVYAYEIGSGASVHTARKTRIGAHGYAVVRNKNVSANNYILSVDSQNNSCRVSGPQFDVTLEPPYCNASDTRQSTLAMQVFDDRDDIRNFSFVCFSNMLVSSYIDEE